MRELTADDLGYLTLFEKITGIFPSDYFLLGDNIAFLVEPENLGKAIGKSGANVQRLKSMLRKKVFVVPAESEPTTLADRYFTGVRILDMRNDGHTLLVYVDDRDRGIAIGKNGERIKLAKELFQKKFNLKIELKARSVL